VRRRRDAFDLPVLRRRLRRRDRVARRRDHRRARRPRPSGQPRRLCSKGATLHLTAAESITRQTRLLQPMRRPARGAAAVAIGWDDALDEAADRIAAIACAHGPEAIGFYLSGQLLTEDYYVFNKLARGVLARRTSTAIRACA
jgi:anaerobic selenocysteine-containing dehydrogenase